MAQHAFDDFVSKVIKDPENPVRAIFLAGFLGASSKKNHVRLYTDISLREYYEIPEDDILHTIKTATRESPLGGTFVWVTEDACITPSHRIGMFDDPVTVGCPIPSETLTCPPTPYPGCGPSTHPAECPTGGGCGTQFSCPPPITRLGCPPPRTVGCQTLNCPTGNCQTLSLGCPTRQINCPTRLCTTRTGCASATVICPTTRQCFGGTAETQAYPPADAYAPTAAACVTTTPNCLSVTAQFCPPTLTGCPAPTMVPYCPTSVGCPLPTQTCPTPTFNPYVCPPPTAWPYC
jgi:hypothetical protein